MKRALAIVALGGWLTIAATVGTALGSSVPANGDFSVAGTPPDPFADWTTFASAFPTDGGGFALFSESTSFAQTQLEQTFNLPPGSSLLSFEFLLATVPNGSAGVPPDSFQATLYNTSFDSLFPSDPLNPLQFPAFYSMDATGQEFYDSSYVSVLLLGNGWTRVTLDVSSLLSQDVLLEFLLNGNEDGRTTTASLDNVVVVTSAVVPEPSYLIPLLASSVICWVIRLRPRSQCRDARR